MERLIGHELANKMFCKYRRDGREAKKNQIYTSESVRLMVYGRHLKEGIMKFDSRVMAHEPDSFFFYFVMELETRRERNR